MVLPHSRQEPDLPYNDPKAKFIDDAFKATMSLSVNDQTFNQEVVNSSVPVLVNFWAPWCGFCRMIKPLLHHFQEDWEGKVKLVDVNADENLRLANLYRLTTLPTLLFVENGETCVRWDGFRGRDELRIALNSFMHNRESNLSLPTSTQRHLVREISTLDRSL